MKNMGLSNAVADKHTGQKVLNRAELSFRKKIRIRVKATGQLGTIILADNRKRKHLVLLIDSQKKQLFSTDEIELAGG